MDFLNKAYAQLTDLFRSMTPGARITAGLLLAVVVVSLGYLFNSHVSGPDADLLGGMSFSASDLPAVEAAFAEAGLNDYRIEGTRVRVPRNQQNLYVAALAEAKALPPDFSTAFDEALDASSAFTPEKERKERLKHAKQKTLGMMISSMRGIERAYVVFDEAYKPGFRREKLITASANVEPLGREALDEQQASAVQHLVAGAIAGLKPEAVVVLDTNSGRVWGGQGEEGTPDGRNSVFLALKRKYEQQWENKILSALAYVPGATVTAEVELDREKINRSESTKIDPKPTAVYEKDESTTKNQQGGGPAGRPGFVSQQPNTAQSLASSRTATSSQDEEVTAREVQSVPSTESTQKELVGMTPQRVAVSIGIPSAYFEKIWRGLNPTGPGQEPATPEQADLDKIRMEETAKIQQFVANLLPAAEGVADPTELVTVSTFQQIATELPPEPGFSQAATTWLGQHWRTLGMIGLAAFSLLMLRSMIKAAPVRPGSNPNILSMTAENEEQEEAAPAAGRLARFSGSGVSLRDELSDLVKEDPDAAANILRTWIGSVG